MAEINLVPEEAKKTEGFEKLKGKLTLASVVILILTAIAAFVTLAFFAFFISEREKLLTRVEDASATVNSYKEVEELLVVAKDKSATADQLIGAKLNRVDVINTLTRIIPQNVYFTDVKLSSDSVSFSGRARSSADVAGLVSALLSQEGKKILTSIGINSLVSDETGVYSFSMSGALAE